VAERIRDATVAEAIAAEAGTDATPELVLSEVVNPVLLLQQRPPLAISGYIPGTMGISAAAVALNRGLIGIFIRGFAPGAVGRVNWAQIKNPTAGVLEYHLRRVDSPFTGFPSTRLTPGYINAGAQSTGSAFSILRTDNVGFLGSFIAAFSVEGGETLHIPGPWVLNDGILAVQANTVNSALHAAFGYELWPAIRPQPAG